MKKEKKGFTLIEIIISLAILIAIAGIFSINFIKNLNDNKERDYDNIVKKIEASADAYVTMHKNSETDDYEDIKLVIENDKTFTYITLDELKNDGLINEKSMVNPKSGETLNGIVKFSKENEAYDFTYIPNPKNYVTFIFNRNGADSISRTAKAIECDSTNVAQCITNELLPSITREGGRIFGWSLDKDIWSTNYKENTSLKNILLEENYEIKDNRIDLYAITSEDILVYFEDIDIPDVTNSKSCTVHNTTPTCKIEMPYYTIDEYHEQLGWNTNIDGSGYNYKIGTSLEVEKNITLYTEKKVKSFETKINKLKRTKGTSIVPSNINLYLVLDTSGSMSSGRLTSLKTVTTGLIDRMNFSNSTVSLITFASSSATPLKFSSDRLRIKSEINRLSAYGGTNFEAAIMSTARVLQDVPNDKSNFVIIVSDGYPTVSISPSSPILTSLKNSSTIYTMGIGSSHDRAYMISLATKPETYYAYDEYTDDRSLSKFYKIFEDIVENITILEGDGEENAIAKTVEDGKLELGDLVLSDKYPLTVYLNNNIETIYNSENEYLYKEKGKYYFDIYKYAKNKPSIGLKNMANLRIKFFYTED